MQEKINFLRNLDGIIIPYDFTYLHHSTSYIPKDLKNRTVNKGNIKNWTILPYNEFVIRKEMSFVTRDNRIEEVITQKKPLTTANIIYNLPDYSKPFCIRIIIPKINAVIENKISVSNEYKKELQKIYNGYGENRYPKLKGGEKIILIGSSTKDEISGKTIDIFYAIREFDIDLYIKSIAETIKSGYIENSEVNLQIFDKYGKNIDFYPYSYSIEKNKTEERYIGVPSEFEQELYNDYKDEIEKSQVLPRIFNHHKYYKLYNNYCICKNKNNIKL